MENNEITNQLKQFYQEPIFKILSSEKIENEEARFVKFSFDGTICVAITWEDGTIYTPKDWQANIYTDFKQSDIETIDWCDLNGNDCIMFNGMPRMLL